MNSSSLKQALEKKRESDRDDPAPEGDRNHFAARLLFVNIEGAQVANAPQPDQEGQQNPCKFEHALKLSTRWRVSMRLNLSKYISARGQSGYMFST